MAVVIPSSGRRNYIKVAVLVENVTRQKGILGEHGLSFWIDAGEQKILFDTGGGQTIFSNAKALDVDLSSTTAVVLSHGHYDHVGGVEAVLEATPQAGVFFQPQALEAKFARDKSGQVRKLSIPFLDEGKIESAGHRIQYVTEPTEVAEGIFATGPIPRITEFEDVGGPFFLDEGLQKPDPMMDDQALYFTTYEGVVLILGCCHAGIGNTLHYISQITGKKNFHTIIGGLHLCHATPQRLESTLKILREYDIRRIGANHCTGAKAMAALWKEFPERCFECAAGARLEFIPSHPF